jgi:hypothetical protein
MWTAASVLALRSPEFQFNPARPENLEKQSENGLSYLETFVRQVLQGSFQDSALFWHYAMRHVPSESLVCASDLLSRGSTQKAGRLKFADMGVRLEARDPAAFQQPPEDGFPLYGYAGFPLGSAPSGCLCGWKLIVLPAGDQCEAPSIGICSAVGLPVSNSRCLYNATDEAMEARILNEWKPEWPCPDTDISDGWGIVPSTDAEPWITFAGNGNMTASLPEVMYSGRSGLRIGNMRTISQDAKNVMKPLSRKIAKANAQKACGRKILETFDPVSLSRAVADELIPASQAVSTESWAVSACLRFSIEFLRLRVLKTLADMKIMQFRVNEISQAAELQQGIVQGWKHKCESQLGMVAVCQGNGLFDLIPTDQESYNCPFTIGDAYQGQHYYVGPSSCLVYVKSTASFYDPCHLSSNPCASVIKSKVMIASLLLEQAVTKIRFDVRSLGNGEILGTWPVRFTGEDAQKNEVASAAASLLEEWRTSKTMGVPWRLSMEFAEKIVEGGGSHESSRGSVGNTQQQWSAAEGFASENTDFCDGIAGDFICVSCFFLVFVFF